MSARARTLDERAKPLRSGFERHRDDPARYCHCSLLRKPADECPTGVCKRPAPKRPWRLGHALEVSAADLRGIVENDGHRWNGSGSSH